jgi:hypothetical protein
VALVDVNSTPYRLSEFYSNVRDISFMNIIAIWDSLVVISTNPMRLKKQKKKKTYISVGRFENYSSQIETIYFVEIEN